MAEEQDLWEAEEFLEEASDALSDAKKDGISDEELESYRNSYREAKLHYNKCWRKYQASLL